MLHREWLGFGFLNRRNTNQKFIIENELYANPDEAEEVATGVESAPFQIILTVGYIGLIVVLVFYIGLWVMIRKLAWAGWFNSAMWCIFIMGISGLGGWIVPETLFIMSMPLAAVILANRQQLGCFAPLRAVRQDL